MTYKFVTREEVEKTYERFSCADEHYTGDTSECCTPVFELKLLAGKILAERNAYREVAKKMKDAHSSIHGAPCNCVCCTVVKDIDAEVARLLEHGSREILEGK